MAASPELMAWVEKTARNMGPRYGLKIHSVKDMSEDMAEDEYLVVVTITNKRGEAAWVNVCRTFEDGDEYVAVVAGQFEEKCHTLVHAFSLVE